MSEITGKLTTALPDRYRIERHLGEGGMATVYLAEDLKHKCKVAVKVLAPKSRRSSGPSGGARQISGLVRRGVAGDGQIR